MDHLKDVVLAAWARIKPLLDADPDERAARLARRRNTARLQRPLREWCVAVKANDRRWNPHDFVVTPEDAPALHLPHQVTLDKRSLRRLCHPVATGAPESDLKDAARAFGVTPAYLLAAARRGQFRLRRIKGYAGKRDRWGGIPGVFSPNQLDPNAGNRMQGPDPVWGTAWHNLYESVPDDFTQTVTRIPQHNPLSRDLKNQNLEEDAQTDDSPLSDSSLILHPSSLQRRPPPQPPRTLQRFACLNDPPNSRFWGWRWLCPGCGQTCRYLFYPTPPFVPRCIRNYLKRHDPEALDHPPTSFACNHCHRVRGGVSWAANDAWNHVIATLSAGLLFGHEVEIPATLARQKKFDYPKAPQHRPTPKRDEVLDRLVKGWTYPQIAKDLGISEKTVAYHTLAARQAHGVNTNKQLIEKLNAHAARTNAKTA